jgi:hypothetical protein
MNIDQALQQGTIRTVLITALITSILVGVFGKKLAEFILGLIIRPLSFIGDVLYRWIAPRNPLAISLRTYKRHLLRSNLTRIETPFGVNITVELERAFAPLKLISRESDTRVDLFPYAREALRSMVLGGPGTGKTTLMKTLVVNTLSPKDKSAVPGTIPVFVVLRNLARNQQTVEQAIVAAFAAHHFPGAERFVQSTLEAGRLLVVLDGLDEVGQSREFVVEEIRRFCEYDDQRQARNRVFVTCREHSYRTRDLADVIPNVLHVEPFANEHMRTFLKGWPSYRNRAAISLYQLIQGDHQIRDICRNPLLLTILTGLYLVSERFELPTSRQRFYQAAIDELLIQRPARRGIKQSFDPEIKRQILERVALERLESYSSTDDPEEFSLASIEKHSTNLLGEGVDVRSLIKELVDINGVLKPSREDIFTCAHRTIQEYFAAREAVRRRTVEEVVLAAGDRPELIEMLYFYCGLVENIPALTRIIDELQKRAQWLVAGRALAQMSEPPSPSAISTVASEVLQMVTSGHDRNAGMEVLLALANRKDPAFSAARAELQAAVDILSSQDVSGASALETAISASPEIAMQVIPVLLNHTEQRWKEAAVQLLGDIGTDEALEQLLRLLESPVDCVRAKAAMTLAVLMRTRSDEIRERANLLPERSDNLIWPLTNHFPSRIMIPMAEALADQAPTHTAAADLAARAVRARSNGDDGEFLHEWKNVKRDFKIRQQGCHLASMLKNITFALIALVAITALVVTFAGDRAYLLTMSMEPLREIPDAHPNALKTAATEVADRIQAATPPDASGWQRLLPWHWSVQPALTGNAKSSYSAMRDWALRHLDPRSLPGNIAAFTEFQRIVPANQLAQLRQSVSPFSWITPLCAGQPCALLLGGVDWRRMIELATILVFPLYVFFDYFPRRPTFKVTKLSGVLDIFSTVQLSAAAGYGVSASFISNSGLTLELVVVGSIAGLAMMVGVLRLARWPKNRYLDQLDSLGTGTLT